MGLKVSEKSVFPTILAVAIFKGIYSHLQKVSGYRRLYLTSYVCRYVIMASLSF